MSVEGCPGMCADANVAYMTVDEVVARVDVLVASVDERLAAAPDLPDLPDRARRRALRVAAGLRTQDVADAIGGVSRAAVYHWESGSQPKPGPARVAYVYLLARLAERFPEI